MFTFSFQKIKIAFFVDVIKVFLFPFIVNTASQAQELSKWTKQIGIEAYMDSKIYAGQSIQGGVNYALFPWADVGLRTGLFIHERKQEDYVYLPVQFALNVHDFKKHVFLEFTSGYPIRLRDDSGFTDPEHCSVWSKYSDDRVNDPVWDGYDLNFQRTRFREKMLWETEGRFGVSIWKQKLFLHVGFKQYYYSYRNMELVGGTSHFVNGGSGGYYVSDHNASIQFSDLKRAVSWTCMLGFTFKW